MEKQVIIQLFKDFIAIQSVSTDSSRYREILKAANFLKNHLEKIGCRVTVLENNHKPPLIIGWLSANQQTHSRKTIAIYGHYDVQPADPIKEWQTPPFRLTLKNGKFYGRGVADNKGHIIQNLAAVKKLIETKRLRNNIVFIFEGEEEVGSVNLENQLGKISDQLSQVDVFFVTDTGAADKFQPQIYYGLRGIIFFQLTIVSGSHDLHSGIYGNRVYNPIHLLAHLIAAIKGVDSHRIKIADFYQRVRKPSQFEVNQLKLAIKDNEKMAQIAGVKTLVKLDNIEPGLATKLYPSFEVNGISGGYTQPGQKTIIPGQAQMKFSFRLVEFQNPDEIEQLVKRFIKHQLPTGVDYQLITMSKSSPFYTDINNRYLRRSKLILETVFGKPCLINRSGGSVPAAEILQRRFSKPVILTGFTLPDDNLHAPDENYDQTMFFKGIEALMKLYSQ